MITIPRNCTGCTACIEICPQGCITAGYTAEGFMKPIAESAYCIECGLCERVCPALNPADKKVLSEIFATQISENEALMNSSSGGFFYNLASSILNQEGIVYGVEIDYEDSCKVKHLRVVNQSELKRLQGSKYVQSELLDIFPRVREDLRAGKNVLFSGTPCQVAGLKRYLMKDYDNLLTVDVICHGVPSPMVWQKYIEEELKNFARKSDGKNMVSLINIPKRDTSVGCILFRDKRLGWQKYGFALQFSEPTGDGEKNSVSLYYDRYENPFMKGFLSDLFLRLSCSNCPVKGFSSGADICLGDAWGIENYIKNKDIDRGYSLIIPLSRKGVKVLNQMDLPLVNVPMEILDKYNPSAYRSVKHHKNRKKFFEMINSGQTVESSVSVCLPSPSYLDKVLWSIKNKMNKLYKIIWQRD